MSDHGNELGTCDYCEKAEAVDRGVVTVGGTPLGPPMAICEDCKDVVA